MKPPRSFVPPSEPALFSERIETLKPSPIRDMLSVVDHPGMISFAGGLPASESLPNWSGSIPRAGLQYGPTEGDPDLRAAISEQLRDLGIDAPPERVMTLTGSQQGIDLVAKLFVDQGTPVAMNDRHLRRGLPIRALQGSRGHARDARGTRGAGLP